MYGRRFALLGMAASLAACSTNPRVYADQPVVDAARIPNTGPTRIEVFTSFNVGTNNGAHSAMFIDASERVVFDPAGTFGHATLPERHDVIYGMRDAARRAFVDYHTRVTFWTSLQTLDVPPATAEWVLRAAEEAGPVPNALCTRSISGILARAPGFPGRMRPVLFPEALYKQMNAIPAVTRREFRQTDDADKEKFWEVNSL